VSRALAVVATAASTLVVSQVAAPEAAQAAQEPAAGKIDVAVTRTDRGVSFKNVGGAASDEAASITCTFVNEYQAPKLRVQKSIEANGGAGGAKSFNVDYKIVATDDGSLAANTGKLIDKPDFAKGLEIKSAKIAETQAGLDTAADATATGGVYTLTDGYYWSVNDLNIDTTYWLVETRAPAGHVLLPRAVPFHIEVSSDASASTVITTDVGTALLGFAGACAWARRRSA